jgi:hypothetical protein
MYVNELVEKHGLGIWVSCKKHGYPKFQVVEKGNQEKEFLCEYEDGLRFTIVDRLNDYELA